MNDQVDGNITFNPPLWMQRRRLTLKLISDLNITQIFDVGCGEGSLLEVMMNDPGVSQLIGLELDQKTAKMALEACQPQEYHKFNLRPNPLHCLVFQGDLSDVWEEMVGVECVTAIEVIEHLHPSTLIAFENNIFGKYKPRVVIVSTPNSEFNVHFDPAGLIQGKYRHDDHKFEWTRSEFQDWANRIADTFHYHVYFDGVGFNTRSNKNNVDIHLDKVSTSTRVIDGQDVNDVGPCTQVAIFIYGTPIENYEISKKGLKTVLIKSDAGKNSNHCPWKYVGSVDHPYFDRSKVTKEQVVKTIKDYVFNDYVYTKNLNKDTNSVCMNIEDIWYSHDVRQNSGTMENLIQIIKSDPETFSITNEMKQIYKGSHKNSTQVLISCKQENDAQEETIKKVIEKESSTSEKKIPNHKISSWKEGLRKFHETQGMMETKVTIRK